MVNSNVELRTNFIQATSLAPGSPQQLRIIFN